VLRRTATFRFGIFTTGIGPSPPMVSSKGFPASVRLAPVDNTVEGAVIPPKYN